MKTWRPRSARADGQQNFLAERILELLELQRRLTLVAQHFEHGRTALFRHLYAPTFEIYDVHLQRFDQKVPVVAAIRTGQRHLGLLSLLILWDGPGARNVNPAKFGE